MTTLGFVGYGHLGSAFARGLAERGATVLAWDAAADAAMRARAKQAGVTLVDAPSGLADAELVFSTVPPMHALAAAQVAAASIGARATWVDLNSLGPDEKRAVAGAVASAGRPFVDGAVLGAAGDGLKAAIILSGASAAATAERMAALGFRVRAVGERPGDAAAIKIVRSVLAKGLEALYVEALVAARRLGVEREVLATFCEFLDARPAAATAELLVTTHVAHAERRAFEVAMSVAAVEAAGVEPRLARAIRDVLEATARSGVAAEFGGRVPPTMASALEALDRKLGASA